MSDTTTTLKVTGWGCEGCTSATKDALEKLEGVRSVKTDLDKGTAEIVHDDKVPRFELEKAVASAGYQVVG